MHVVATAGHVDHGKSTLVRALTGMEPDRLDEERRRGLTIQLGYAWTELPSGETLAFVDVPGHERFLGTMLAGVGPVPAVMFVVAADEGWMPQSEEHLVALEALGVRHCLLVVTRSDLADPAPATEQSLARLEAALGAGACGAVAVSGRTGNGLDELRLALDRLVAGLPRPDPGAEVRLWTDRAFSVTGSGTVVTGTLPEGTVSVGDELLLDGHPVRVRGLESLKRSRESVSGVARVAVNLRGRDLPDRGQALVSPGGWTYTDIVDVHLTPVGALRQETARLPRRLTVHLGSAAVTAEARTLGGPFARLRLDRPLPLHLGDVLLLRDPGRDRSEVRVLAGATILDVRPPSLHRRGAARARATHLSTALNPPPTTPSPALPPTPAAPAVSPAASSFPPSAPPAARPASPAGSRTSRGASSPAAPSASPAVPRASSAASRRVSTSVLPSGSSETSSTPPAGFPAPASNAAEAAVLGRVGEGSRFDVGFVLRLHRLVRGADLRAMGVVVEGPGVAGEWHADPRYWEELRRRLSEVVRRYADRHPLEPAMPVEAARHELGLPDRRLVAALVEPPLTLNGGRIAARRAGLPEPVARAVERVRRELASRPFQAPEAGRLAELGLGPKELAAAVRAGSLLRLGEGIVLLPGADARAAESLRRLPQPFTVSQARNALGTTRRVAVPLLEHLDRTGLTERLDEVRRRCR